MGLLEPIAEKIRELHGPVATTVHPRAVSCYWTRLAIATVPDIPTRLEPRNTRRCGIFPRPAMQGSP